MTLILVYLVVLILVAIVLFGWIPIVRAIFRRFDARTAVAIAFVAS